MSNLSDMHVHIDYFKNYKHIYSTFATNKIYALFVTNLPEIFQKCKEEFPENKYVKLALGFNPQLADKYKFNQELYNTMLPLTKYIGEVGLDYSKEFIHTKNEQQRVFEYISNTSANAKKIMSIHSRGAEADVLEILKNNKVEFAIFHWYTGNKELAYKIADQGYYFSVNYSMLSSNKGIELIKSLPLDRLLIETDAPFGRANLKGIQYNLSEIYYQFSKKLGVYDFDKIIYNNLRNLLIKQRDSNKSTNN